LFRPASGVNGGAFLQAAIESILTQDDSDFEFLIIDDYSRDDSAEVIRRYASAATLAFAPFITIGTWAWPLL
jgi:hypothetical protein